MKKLISALLLVSLVFCLCACGETQNNNETTPTVTDPAPTEPEAQGVTYTIRVVDEGGNPVAGAMVQLCSDLCLPKLTDADGFAGERIYTGHTQQLFRGGSGDGSGKSAGTVV